MSQSQTNAFLEASIQKLHLRCWALEAAARDPLEKVWSLCYLLHSSFVGETHAKLSMECSFTLLAMSPPLAQPRPPQARHYTQSTSLRFHG
jgi:hypothetical protein